MKEKIILDKKRGNKEIGLIYHYYKIIEENNVMHIYYTSGSKNYLEKYLEIDVHFHFPMAKVPEIVKAMTEIFYTCNPWKGIWSKTVDLDDSQIHFGPNFEERLQRMTSYTITQKNGKQYGEEGVIFETVDLEWENAEPVYVEDKKRKMPKGLAVLIKGIKDYYNKWQKEHPEYERIK